MLRSLAGTLGLDRRYSDLISSYLSTQKRIIRALEEATDMRCPAQEDDRL